MDYYTSIICLHLEEFGILSPAVQPEMLFVIAVQETLLV
jgi:hypothetical protein